jgi:uncharacterized protein (DUF488 family)
MQNIYTIGHSNHSVARFIELLKAHDVRAIADVRSHPYSRYNPQFNHESLQAALKDCDLSYVFLGGELGARSEDPACYVEEKVDYERLARTPLFQRGLIRLMQGSKDCRIALMCAEQDPLTCHRAILIARHLAARGIDVRHILGDGRIEPHEAALSRLLAELRLPEHDLFRSREEMIREAYEQRGARIAYRRESPAIVGRQPA